MSPSVKGTSLTSPKFRIDRWADFNQGNRMIVIRHQACSCPLWLSTRYGRSDHYPRRAFVGAELDILFAARTEIVAP